MSEALQTTPSCACSRRARHQVAARPPISSTVYRFRRDTGHRIGDRGSGTADAEDHVQQRSLMCKTSTAPLPGYFLAPHLLSRADGRATREETSRWRPQAWRGHPKLRRRSTGPSSRARRGDRVRASFAAVHESAFDAVDGSSTGTEVPWMWVLLRPPRFGGAKHASGHDNWSRYR